MNEYKRIKTFVNENRTSLKNLFKDDETGEKKK